MNIIPLGMDNSLVFILSNIARQSKI